MPQRRRSTFARMAAIWLCFGAAGRIPRPTEAADASLRWISPHDLSAHAYLVIRGFAFSRTISINGRQVGTLSQLKVPSQPSKLFLRLSELFLPLDMRPGEREINVHIHIDNPRSPRELGLSSDDRKLGLFVQSVRIEDNPQVDML
jgi:hypothetical protein